MQPRNTTSPVIDALDERTRASLLDHAVTRRVEAGTRLHLAGETSQRTHLVRSGLIKLVGSTFEGDETILMLVLPGELVGDAPLADDAAHPLEAVAASAATVTGFDTRTLRAAITASPRASAELARCLAQRVRWMCAVTVERTYAEVPERLAGRLLDLAPLMGGNGSYELQLPQRDIAGLAGMCRESACKAMRRFRRAGAIDYRRGRVRVLRPEVLEAIRFGEPV